MSQTCFKNMNEQTDLYFRKFVSELLTAASLFDKPASSLYQRETFTCNCNTGMEKITQTQKLKKNSELSLFLWNLVRVCVLEGC